MPRPDRSIFYAIDASAQYVHLVARSAASIRRFNPKIPIRAIVFGSIRGVDTTALEEAGVTVVPRRADARKRYTYLKWLALSDVRERSALFLDADTIAFADPALLFERYASFDFCAREEMGTQADGRSYLLGTFLVRPQVDWPNVRRIEHELGLEARPMFNTGVMLFNRGSHRRIEKQLHVMFGMAQHWQRGTIPYPCSNLHIMEQLAAALMLGAVPRLRHGFFTPADVPFFIEHRGAVVPGPGIVLHTWSEYYPFYLEEFEGAEAREAYEREFLRAPRT